MSKPTIIFLAPTPPPYMGPSTATQVLLNSRFVEEFDVIHIDTADRRSLDNLGKLDFMNVYLALKHYALLLIKLISTRAELVYVPISQTSIGYLRDIPFILLPKLFGKKLVLHLRGGYFREFYESSNWAMKFVVRQTLQRVDRMIVLGKGLKRIFEGLLPEEKLSVVPNGLDLDLSRYPDKKNSEVINVVYLGNLIKTKGFFEVLQAAGELKENCNKVKFIFAGDWRDETIRQECESFIENQGLDGFVSFVGPVFGKEKIELLKGSDIFAFPTYYPPEGHPWVVVEAMAAGLPIISTDQGAITESVLEGVNGFIVEKRNPAQMAEKIKLLIEDEGLREKMGSNSRKLYLESFTKDHFCQRMTGAIREALES